MRRDWMGAVENWADLIVRVAVAAAIVIGVLCLVLVAINATIGVLSK